MNTDLAKRTILPAYIKYQDDLNADESNYKAAVAFAQKVHLAHLMFIDKFEFNTKDGIATIQDIWNDEYPESINDIPDSKMVIRFANKKSEPRLIHLKDVDFKLISKDKKDPFNFVIELAE